MLTSLCTPLQVIVFKKKRRKGYRRWKGHRAPLSVLRVREIALPPLLEAKLDAAEERRAAAAAAAAAVAAARPGGPAVLPGT